MGILRQSLLIALVALTSASTLLAGIPRLECVCPAEEQASDSNQLSSGKSKTGADCCCAGCPGKRCCCTNGRARPDTGNKHLLVRRTKGRQVAPAGDKVQAPVCGRTLVRSIPAVLSAVNKTTQTDESLSVVVSVLPAKAARSWSVSEFPLISHPPGCSPDLVIILQHFLI
jgi:hypothetical protein